MSIFGYCVVFYLACNAQTFNGKGGGNSTMNGVGMRTMHVGHQQDHAPDSGTRREDLNRQSTVRSCSWVMQPK